MRRVSFHFVVLLAMTGAFAGIRWAFPVSYPRHTHAEGLALGQRVPYEIGNYVGKDMPNSLTESVADLHQRQPNQVVLRNYCNPMKNCIELYAVAGDAVDMTMCFKYAGWVTRFSRDRSLDTSSDLRAREVILLSPEDQSPQVDGCLVYVKDEGKHVTFASPISFESRQKVALLLGEPVPWVSVRLCQVLPDEGISNYRETFQQLEHFARLVDPFISDQAPLPTR